MKLRYLFEWEPTKLKPEEVAELEDPKTAIMARRKWKKKQRDLSNLIRKDAPSERPTRRFNSTEVRRRLEQ